MISRLGWILVGLALVPVFSGDGARLATVPGAVAWLVHTAVPFLLGLALIELALVVAGTFSARARARFDRRLRSALRGAASKLPDERRSAYLREWEAELHEILAGPPLARVWPAVRYVVGLRRAAPAIARVLDPDRPRAMGRRVRTFVVTLALVPVVTPVFLLLVTLIVAGMALVAVWAAAVAVGRRVAFRPTFVRGCRRSGLVLFGWPTPITDTPDEQTLLSL